MSKSNNEKIAIISDNQMKAVLIPIDEYEKLKNIEATSEELGNKQGYDLTGYRKMYAYKRKSESFIQ